MPNLVNLNEDPQLSEMLLYMIKEGKTTVGKCRPNSCHDIQLSGILIADDHWYVLNKEIKNEKCLVSPFLYVEDLNSAGVVERAYVSELPPHAILPWTLGGGG